MTGKPQRGVEEHRLQPALPAAGSCRRNLPAVYAEVEAASFEAGTARPAMGNQRPRRPLGTQANPHRRTRFPTVLRQVLLKHYFGSRDIDPRATAALAVAHLTPDSDPSSRAALRAWAVLRDQLEVRVDDDGSSLWWPIATTESPRNLSTTLTGHTSSVYGVAFGTTTNGQLLVASASHDRTVRVWNPSTFQPLATISIGATVESITIEQGLLGIAVGWGTLVLQIRDGDDRRTREMSQ